MLADRSQRFLYFRTGSLVAAQQLVEVLQLFGQRVQGRSFACIERFYPAMQAAGGARFGVVQALAQLLDGGGQVGSGSGIRHEMGG